MMMLVRVTGDVGLGEGDENDVMNIVVVICDYNGRR